MAGLVPAIHVFTCGNEGQDVDHRDKPGDDDKIVDTRSNEKENGR
jgi:hypothetical protein